MSDREALYDLSDDALEDIIREGWAEEAAIETRHEIEAVEEQKHKHPDTSMMCEEAERNQVSPDPIPAGARRDEIFANVVHDSPKKIKMYPDRWSKGEVLDYLSDQALDEFKAEHLAKHAGRRP